MQPNNQDHEPNGQSQEDLDTRHLQDGNPSGEQDQSYEDDADFDEEEDGSGDDNDSSDDPDTFEINGEKVSKEELIKGYMRQSDYSRKTAELSALKDQAFDVIRRKEAEREQEVDPKTAEIKKQISEMGFMSADEFDRKLAQMQMRAKLETEREQVQKSTGVSDTVVEAAQFIRAKRRAEGREESLDSIVRELTGTSEKVVKRKTVGVQGSSGTQSSKSKSYVTYTEAQIEAMDANSKEFAEVSRLNAAGNLRIIK